jgi:hypothetical protein
LVRALLKNGVLIPAGITFVTLMGMPSLHQLHAQRIEKTDDAVLGR